MKNFQQNHQKIRSSVSHCRNCAKSALLTQRVRSFWSSMITNLKFYCEHQQRWINMRRLMYLTAHSHLISFTSTLILNFQEEEESFIVALISISKNLWRKRFLAKFMFTEFEASQTILWTRIPFIFSSLQKCIFMSLGKKFSGKIYFLSVCFSHFCLAFKVFFFLIHMKAVTSVWTSFDWAFSESNILSSGCACFRCMCAADNRRNCTEINAVEQLQRMMFERMEQFSVIICGMLKQKHLHELLSLRMLFEWVWSMKREKKKTWVNGTENKNRTVWCRVVIFFSSTFCHQR